MRTEAGLDAFGIHQVLQSEGIESHVVDAASILTSRRRRRVKTDRIDSETLGAHPDGRQAWRAAGAFDGQGADAAGRRTGGVSAASAGRCHRELVRWKVRAQRVQHGPEFLGIGRQWSLC